MYELLKFNKKYYQNIITGVKTQTIRKHNKKFRKDEIVKAIFPGTNDECYLQITGSGYKQFKYLDHEDARLEGYSTLEELKSDLLDIYPLLDAMTRIYWIRFKVVDEIV